MSVSAVGTNNKKLAGPFPLNTLYRERTGCLSGGISGWSHGNAERADTSHIALPTFESTNANPQRVADFRTRPPTRLESQPAFFPFSEANSLGFSTVKPAPFGGSGVRTCGRMRPVTTRRCPARGRVKNQSWGALTCPSTVIMTHEQV